MVEWMGRHLFLELIDQNIHPISPKLLVGLEHVALQGHLIKRNKVTNNTKIAECALKCTQQANDRKAAGCCEYRVETENCAWSPDGTYLAPEVRNLEGEPKDNLNTKSVLCTKGNSFNTRINKFNVLDFVV